MKKVLPTATARKLETSEELAARYNVSTRTVANWRASGRVPFLRITARCIRYHADEVDRALGSAA